MSAWYPLVRNLSAFSTRLGVLRSPSRVGSSPSSASSCLIRSCIVLLYLSLGGASAQVALRTADENPDVLYANRADLASAKRAAELWDGRLRHAPPNFEFAWKLARADYWL